MGGSSTQIPFMLAAFLAAVVYGATADPAANGRHEPAKATTISAKGDTVAVNQGQKLQQVIAKKI